MNNCDAMHGVLLVFGIYRFHRFLLGTVGRELYLRLIVWLTDVA